MRFSFVIDLSFVFFFFIFFFVFQVVKESYVDHTQFDQRDPHFDR